MPCQEIHERVTCPSITTNNTYFFYYFIFLFRAAPAAYGPGWGWIGAVASSLYLSVYTTATAMPDTSHIWDLHHSSQQCRIPNPLTEARDWTHILKYASWVHYRWAMPGTPLTYFFSLLYTETFFFLFRNLLTLIFLIFHVVIKQFTLRLKEKQKKKKKSPSMPSRFSTCMRIPKGPQLTNSLKRKVTKLLYLWLVIFSSYLWFLQQLSVALHPSSRAR